MSQSAIDPKANTAFRSFWTAPPQPGRAPDMYDFDPNYQTQSRAHQQRTRTRSADDDDHGHSHAGTAETSALLGDDRASNGRDKVMGVFTSWRSLCLILLPLILIALAVYWGVHYWLGGDTAPVVVGDDTARIAAQCNPFAFVDHSVDIAHDHGLVAYLSVLPVDQRGAADGVRDYRAESVRINGTLFFAALDTPTRLFTDRFVAHNTSEGVSEDSGDDDITLPSEYFYLEFHTRVLPPVSVRQSNDSYQFALISDDGAIIIIDDDVSVLIDNDGIHSTRMAQSIKPVTFATSSDDYLSLTLQYFQGPAAHIALQLLYRVWSDDLTKKEIANANKHSDSGNDLFWSVTTDNTPSIPTEQYESVLKSGWSVVPAEWYWLPERYDGKKQVDDILAAGGDPCRL